MSYVPPGPNYEGYPPPYPPPGQSGYGSPYPGYQPYYPGPMPPSTNPWAIASLICSIVGISILGIIFGHIALGEIRRSNGWQVGRGMALAGLIIGYAEVALGLIFVLVFFGVFFSAPHLRY